MIIGVRLRSLLVLAVALAGCYEVTLKPCGSRLCPRDRACFQPGDRCVLPAAITACSGLADQEPCAFEGQSEGVCSDGLCELARCGDGAINGNEECDEGALNSDTSDATCRADCRLARCGDQIVDPARTEACDDGNASNGDGCSSDCRSLEACGNGIIDPAAGEQCDDGNRISGDGCQDGCILPRCGDGVTDESLNEACDNGAANSMLSDACRPNCQLARCGDGVQDLGANEVCDDGNLDAGDGCRPDCRSNETCGNGVLDVVQGELCDDNLRARDGCSACRPETLHVRVFGPTPTGRRNAATAYDAGRQRIVMFGGVLSNETTTNETWEWDGTSWERMLPATSPPARRYAEQVYDAARHRIVLFGGQSVTTSLGDTWIWDGIEWTAVLLTTRPPARHGHALAYDSARRRVVLYGGASGETDTWEWDGSTWTEVVTLASPPTSTLDLSMAYDPLRREVVLFHSADGTTWVYDGTTWTQRFPATSPPARSYSMAFDTAAGAVALVGLDTWHWNGTDWSAATTVAPARDDAAVAYDIARGSLVVHSGWNGVVHYTDTWRRSGSSWSDVSTPLRPSPRSSAATMYDPTRDRVVLFGGRDNLRNALNDTWEWDGHRWLEIATSVQPSPRGNATFTYDEELGKGLLMGGAAGDGYNNPGVDAWTWNGATWESASAPADTTWGWMVVYDRSRARTVMVAAGTWERSNGSWTQTGSAGPSSRYNTAMAYDPVRAVTILFGGRVLATGDRLADTWEYSGTWVERPNTSLLEGRRGHAMTFSPQRGRVVLVGGENYSTPLADLWEWTGTTWVEPALTSTFTPRYRPAFAAQSSTGQLVMFGGRSPGGASVLLDDTVLFEYRPNAVTEACTSGTLDYDGDGLAGCADPDCALKCAPMCLPGTTCTTSPRCGDGTCNGAEACRWCPEDCGTCPGAVCGDLWCDPPETVASCPADC